MKQGGLLDNEKDDPLQAHLYHTFDAIYRDFQRNMNKDFMQPSNRIEFLVRIFFQFIQNLDSAKLQIMA